MRNKRQSEEIIAYHLIDSLGVEDEDNKGLVVIPIIEEILMFLMKWIITQN